MPYQSLIRNEKENFVDDGRVPVADERLLNKEAKGLWTPRSDYCLVEEKDNCKNNPSSRVQVPDTRSWDTASLLEWACSVSAACITRGIQNVV